MKRLVALAALLALSVVASDVQAQGAGDPRGGLAIARQVCSECHAIQKGQVRSPNLRSPTFVELANTPGMTAAALTVALMTPHWRMPMFILTPEQRANIIAYILSLKE
jgi:mono/diheme cytochrome c family protein